MQISGCQGLQAGEFYNQVGPSAICCGVWQVATDVEGSTQLWEWDPVVMGAAVEQHNVVLRRLLEQHGGHEVRTDGDSFTLAFHDATDAVAYCIQVSMITATGMPGCLLPNFQQQYG